MVWLLGILAFTSHAWAMLLKDKANSGWVMTYEIVLQGVSISLQTS